MAYTKSGIYIPKNVVVIASSFEGIVNDGATECALTSLNAYHNQNPDAFLGRKIDSKEFSENYIGSTEVKAFLALRPMVAVAEDYHTVLEMIRQNQEKASMLVDDKNNVELYSFFEEEFKRIKERTKEERDVFGKAKEGFFYKERKALQEADYDAWNNTQKPYDDTLPQFRLLVDTQQWMEGLPIRGFYPRFATSKDEDSTHKLCILYTKVQKLEPGDTEGNRCLIPRDGIIGIETVPSKKKSEQLAVLANRFGIPRDQVWRLNDRYDINEQEELKNAGFENQFFLPGYTTPHEIEKVKTDSMIRLLDRNNFAKQLSDFAEKLGL
ncbi:MAG: hypothetical protein V1870_04990 [Candidatus Aenigmatarchaeota archaeon]